MADKKKNLKDLKKALDEAAKKPFPTGGILAVPNTRPIYHTLGSVDHPLHYGGADNPYEAIKVIESWGLGFNLGNTLKYIARAGKKGEKIMDLEKARFYLEREINNLKKE